MADPRGGGAGGSFRRPPTQPPASTPSPEDRRRTRPGSWLPARVGAPAWQRLSALPDDERDAIALVYFCGHGPDELIGELDQSADIWAKRIRSGLGRLARQSSGEEPWPS